MELKKICIGITGASGVVIGIRLIEELIHKNINVISIITENAQHVIHHELNKDFKLPSTVQLFNEHDVSAPVNSSSILIDSMVIVPCSMKTLAAIANGYAFNLIARAADNQLRTGKKLIVVPRETPLSTSHLENMLKLNRAGAVICPPMAAYYHHPKSVDDMTDFFVGKILDLLGIQNELYRRWEANSKS